MTVLSATGRLVGHDSTLLSGGSLGSPYGVLHAQRDFRNPGDTRGVIKDRVMLKPSPSAPEQPFANGRVLMLRYTDGYKAWEGFSDSQGYYRATGLEVGVEYVPVGIDPTKEHKSVAAGPVLAKLEVA